MCFSSREQSATLSSNLNALEKSQGDLESKLGSMQDQHQQDASKLKVQLAQAENRTKSLQKEVLSVFSCLVLNFFYIWDVSTAVERRLLEEVTECHVSLFFLV